MTQPSEFGSAFHTALRKASDTDWSVLLWNLLNVRAFDGAWMAFTRFGAVQWDEGHSVESIMTYWGTNGGAGDVPETAEERTLRWMLRLCDSETVEDVQQALSGWLPRKGG